MDIEVNILYIALVDRELLNHSEIVHSKTAQEICFKNPLHTRTLMIVFLFCCCHCSNNSTSRYNYSKIMREIMKKKCCAFKLLYANFFCFFFWNNYSGDNRKRCATVYNITTSGERQRMEKVFPTCNNIRSFFCLDNLLVLLFLWWYVNYNHYLLEFFVSNSLSNNNVDIVEFDSTFLFDFLT